MIKSFRHRGLKRLFEREDRSLIRPDLVDTVENILFVLDEALSVQALAIPRYHLHPLKGKFEGVLVGDGQGELADHLPL